MTNNLPIREAGHSLSPSVGRALSVLRLLMDHPDGLGISEISRALGYPKSSLYSVVNTMHDYEFVAKDPTSKRYMLGPQLLIIGATYGRNNGLLSLFYRFAKRLAISSGETVQLAVLKDRNVLYIGKQEGSQIIRLASDVGTQLPAHATSLGKCLLSSLSDTQLVDLYANVELERLTDRTINNVGELKESIAKVRQHGYAEDQGEALEGVNCFGAPIYDATGEVVAAISISVPSVRLDADRKSTLIQQVQECAFKISQHLGYTTSKTYEQAASGET